jgi:hypothetical protein
LPVGLERKLDYHREAAIGAAVGIEPVLVAKGLREAVPYIG